MELEQWLSDDRVTELVDLSKIDRVPVTFMQPIDDHFCAPELHEAWFHSITSPNSYLTYERGGHGNPLLFQEDAYVNRLVSVIETGTVDPNDGGPKSSFSEKATTGLL